MALGAQRAVTAKIRSRIRSGLAFGIAYESTTSTLGIRLGGEPVKSML